jgi:predicted esterase
MLIAVAVVCLGDSQNATAQNGLPVVVTMKSNVSFEGDLIPVEGFGSKMMPTGTAVWAIDEGHRRVFVSRRRIQNNTPSTRIESTIPIWQNAVSGNPSFVIPLSATAFDKNGHRVLTISDKPRPARYTQGITKINPRYVELKALKGGDATKKVLTMYLGLNQVPPEVVRNLLRNQIKNGNSSLEYRELISFYLQAQQFGEAIETLRFMRQKFPEESDDLENIQIKIRQDEARQILTEIGLRKRNGQPELAKGMAGLMKLDGVAPQAVAELQQVIEDIETTERRVNEAREKIASLIEKFKTDMTGKPQGESAPMLDQFLAELQAELRPSTVSRLDSYMVQADDDAQQDQQKVALAISGWTVGSNNATANFAVAQSLFKVRELIKRYLLSGDANERSAIVAMLEKFESGRQGMPEIVVRMLAQMKPPLHEEATAGYDIEKAPIEFSVAIPGTAARPQVSQVRCLVHLPGEYDPYRKYPLLITLPGQGPLEAQLQTFTGANARLGRASRSGTIVMAVEWRQPGPGGGEYTAREHAAVLTAMRACFRRFSIDTDRVFLHGNDAGANVVYDIGLAHPEHFAGLIPVSGLVEKYAKIHSRDTGIPLAVYAVMGEKDTSVNIPNTEVFDRWLSSDRHLDFVGVTYKGRFHETFPDDVPNMFAWMQYQRRRLPDRLGFDFSVKAMRPWANYYWFMQLDDFPLENVIWPQLWKERNENRPLVIAGELKAQDESPNTFLLKPSRNSGSTTLWLSDEFVDFTQPIWIRSGPGKEFKAIVKPSVKTILEDARIRGDRMHPYWARLKCINNNWQIVE